MFDRFVMVDWSGGNDRGAAPKADAIWACVATRDGSAPAVYLRNRTLAEDWIIREIDSALGAGETICVGFDFPLAYPNGFARHLIGTDDPLALLGWFEARINDSPKGNNRFDIAGQINQTCGGAGPFWGNALKRDIDGLERNKKTYANPFPERRAVEHLAKGSFTCWQMSGAGSVGGQVMMGLPVLDRLRCRFGARLAVWPFEPLDRPVALVEIWPSLDTPAVPDGMIKDQWQVQWVAEKLARMPHETLRDQLNVHAAIEGWILGVPPKQTGDHRHDQAAALAQ